MCKRKKWLLWWTFILCFTASFAQATTQEEYTYKLTQSTSSSTFWTTPPSERVFLDSAVPAATGSGLKFYAAKNEFEPLQVVVLPTSTTTGTVQISEFGAGITVEIYQVKYVNITETSDSLGRLGPYPDPLWPLENGDSVSFEAGVNTAFWFNVYVPASTPAGDYAATLMLNGVSLPVSLHVFNFALPSELHVRSQMNFSHSTILTKYGVDGLGLGDEYWMYVDKIKQYFIDHRLTLKSVLWSGGLTTGGGGPYIDYDCTSKTLSDSDGIWGFEQPAERYLDGTGLMSGTFDTAFNQGTGFPSFMAMTFQNNDPSTDQRPSTFCGQTRTSNDWYTANNPTTAYNQQWFSYIAALEAYLDAQDLLGEAYHYLANEPQNEDDYDAVAWYSRYLKAHAPHLKLMVSEEPKPEIYDHADYVESGQIDIWLPVLNNYDSEVSHERKRNHGESTWIYFLHGTRPPYFNPITLDHPGIESKLTGWLLWKYRIEGIAYYSLNNWSQNPWTDPSNDSHNGDLFMLYPPSVSNETIVYGSNNHRFVPSIRFELMRDSLEDYEYLWMLNGNAAPVIDIINSADTQADKIIGSLTSYCRDSGFMYNLRRVIGLKNGDEIASIPDIQPPAGHPRAEGVPGKYYINFQDPEGNPTGVVSIGGKSYMKIGWELYDDLAGYGWYGSNDHVMSAYQSGPNELQKTILYDDWGRQHTFEFDLPKGTYNVTVSVGWYGRTYNHHKIDIEGIPFVDDEATTPENPYIVRTKKIKIEDSKLTLDMGIFDEYTMLNYLDIEAVRTPVLMAPLYLLLSN